MPFLLSSSTWRCGLKWGTFCSFPVEQYVSDSELLQSDPFLVYFVLILLRIKNWNCGYECLCAYLMCSLIARETINHFGKNLACLSSETRKIIQEVKLQESMPSLIPGEGSSCTSEPQHNRRTAPETKLFKSKRRLGKQEWQHIKLYWSRVLIFVFYVAGQKDGVKAKFVRLGELIAGTEATNSKTSLVSVLAVVLGLTLLHTHYSSTVDA